MNFGQQELLIIAEQSIIELNHLLNSAVKLKSSEAFTIKMRNSSITANPNASVEARLPTMFAMVYPNLRLPLCWKTTLVTYGWVLMEMGLPVLMGRALKHSLSWMAY